MQNDYNQVHLIYVYRFNKIIINEQTNKMQANKLK